jgi:hypothetical protein
MAPLTSRAQPIGNPGAAVPQVSNARPLLLRPDAIVVDLHDLSEGFDVGGVSDVEIGDFTGDGRPDVAVAWYATDFDDDYRNLRRLTILTTAAVPQFVRVAEIDLYEIDDDFLLLSVFYNGTSDVAAGDFDGDGDRDLAVLPFFGDELWLIENLGGGQFAPVWKPIFGVNSPGQFITPPEARAADLNGDGRDELIYISDATQRINFAAVHFWTTTGGVSEMHRVNWEGAGGASLNWTRSLAIGDFAGDSRPDVCFTGTDPSTSFETDPRVMIWYNLNLSSGTYSVAQFTPGFVCSDSVAVKLPSETRGLVLTDIEGTRVEHWERTGGLNFALVAAVDGYAGLSPDRGMSAEVADIDGDNDADLITKQKLGGGGNTNQIEITIGSQVDGITWERVDPTPIETIGFENDYFNQVLRSDNLAVGDLFGNTLREIVGGFSSYSASLTREAGIGTIRIGVWQNSCVGDINGDGVVDSVDLTLVFENWMRCRGESGFDADSDLDKSGCIDETDLDVLLGDWQCTATTE